ncbi:MAG: N-acetyltransferase [Alistipes sp.]|jgi:predicted GNAT family acetyltransferase|nr:N-acetyltransferase [Alistipes sp.]
MSENKDHKVIHKPADHRFEVWEEGTVGYVEYSLRDGTIDILHTIVPPRMEGRGVGSALVKAAYDWGRTEGLRAAGSCRFADAWLRRHPEYN